MSPKSVPILDVQSGSLPVRDSRIFGVISGENSGFGFWILLAAILSGVGLSIPLLTAGPLVLDEYGTYWLADDRSPLSLWERSLNYENIPPLSPWIHRLSLRWLGESEWSFRLPSAVWYVLAIGMSYLMGREIRGPLHGGLCALVTAWHPTALGEVLIARCYAQSLFLSALCFWISLRWMKKPHSGICPLVWALAALALIWTHYLNAAVSGLTGLTLLMRFSQRSILATLSVIGAGIAVVCGCIPLFPAYERMSEWGQYFGFQASVPLEEAIPPIWWVGLPAGLIAGKILQLFDRSADQSQNSSFTRLSLLVLFLWGFSPICVALAIRNGDFASLANPRYRIGFDVAGGCLLVLLVTQQWRTRQPSSLSAVGSVVVCLIASWMFSDHLPHEPKRLDARQSIQWKQLSEYIEQHGTEGELLFVQSGLGEGFLVPAFYDDHVFMDYSACRVGRLYLSTEHPRYALPFRWDSVSEMRAWFVKVLNTNKTAEHPAIWIVSATDTDLNRISLKYFQELAQFCRYEATHRIDLQDATLIRYEPGKQDP